ncbi:magnesium transporter [Spiroplasma chinense]|uniref:Magnesium transporter MgtE n=1 Tax=Spiroplasma chinense TaxID=216932 RepID=A0A5B9Y5L7_9MOLU|nr:magnesium transporter [Spiroplasma chinense]QEH61322.1 magnesium transporter [Spiroplasma chinense]
MSPQVSIEELSEKIKTLLSENKVSELRELAEEYYPADMAEALSEFEDKDIIKALRFFLTEDSAEIFTFFDNEIQEEIIKNYSSEQVKELFEEIFTDDIVDILEEMPSNIVKKVLRASSSESRLQINKILKYEESTAGSIMSVEYTKIRINWTVGQAIELIKKEREETEEVSHFFVVDERNNLLGIVDLKNLFFSKPDTPIESIMDDRFIFSYTKADQEEVAEQFKKYDITILPILNSQNKLVGIITVDDVIDVIEEEATEDIHKLAGISPTEDAYFKTSVWKMVRSRSVWLLFLMISATLSQVVISAFIKIYGVHDGEVTEGGQITNITTIVTVLLTPLLTVISGTAGNAGSQASTMVVRALSLREVETKDFARVMWKEFRVAAITGVILVTVNFLRMIIIYAVQFKGNINQKELWYTIATLSIAMYLTLIVSKLIGGLLPILAKKVRLDPAVMAAPLLTTLVDALSTAIFFSVGLIFFSQFIF